MVGWVGGWAGGSFRTWVGDFVTAAGCGLVHLVAQYYYCSILFFSAIPAYEPTHLLAVRTAVAHGGWFGW